MGNISDLFVIRIDKNYFTWNDFVIPDVLAITGRFDAFQFSDAGNVSQAELNLEAVRNLDRRHERDPPLNWD